MKAALACCVCGFVPCQCSRNVRLFYVALGSLLIGFIGIVVALIIAGGVL